MQWLIYKHTNILTGKAYIGLTRQNAKRRWQNGNGYTKRCQPLFYCAIQQAGGAAAWNTIWTHEILENGIPTIDLANQREIFWISYYGTYAYDKDSSGYNMTLGGNSHVCKEETKQKISAARKGYRVTEDVKHRLSELNSGNGNPFYGQHHSEKTKRLLSEQSKGRKPSKETRQKISVANKGKQPWNKGKAMSEKARQNIKLGRAKQIRKPFTEAQRENFRTAAIKKAVRCIETGDTYSSLSEAAHKTKIAICNISLCLHRKQTVAGGYHWEFVND